jgi:hypothetical protein
MTNSTVYSTTSGDKKPAFEGLSLDLRYELGLPTEESSQDYDPFYDESAAVPRITAGSTMTWLSRVVQATIPVWEWSTSPKHLLRPTA